MQMADTQLRMEADTRAVQNARKIGVWLAVLIAMVFVMIILGGLTRLTGSGLSMVDWRPITGWLPPLNDAEWGAVFDLYKQIPQFHELNADMTVDGFKSIFWLEFVHRLWGRLLGFAFLLPFLVFLFRRMITARMAPRLMLMFVLGGAQGVLGWYMVKSGFSVRTDAYMLWAALSLIRGAGRWRADPGQAGLIWFTALVAAWIALTMTSGGFVAGLDAGLTYNTFPYMDGQLVPDGLFVKSPVWVNLFENITMVQFSHRLMAETAIILVAIAWILGRRRLPAGRARTVFDLLGAMGLLQFALGIATLLLVVPVPLAAAHQAGAFVLLALAIWAVHALGSIEAS
jgi:cytochrome c oxidase assembly protein subunit 15